VLAARDHKRGFRQAVAWVDCAPAETARHKLVGDADRLGANRLGTAVRDSPSSSPSLACSSDMRLVQPNPYVGPPLAVASIGDGFEPAGVTGRQRRHPGR
jgi:hypothetical protein